MLLQLKNKFSFNIHRVGILLNREDALAYVNSVNCERFDVYGDIAWMDLFVFGNPFRSGRHKSRIERG
jgi:hypothetical protein